ncbi:redox-regulatory protein FAM213A-like [Solea senegalensis]|uniref:Peroxiredoxin-like 2A n=1 Tax=Solea senegalensis TaxID=28829 RepID=A0AAV6RPX8_SOLSE|nr:redox-regulatory protein FAM213A-like [Solea senegalensis]
MAGGVVAEVAASVFGLITAVMNFFTNMFLTPPLSATIKHLEEAELKTLTGEPKTIRAKSLWETSGAVIMAEAAELSSLKPQLDELGVPLYAVVKEDIGTEVQNFRPYLKGEIFLDEKKRFYGPLERKMGLLAFLRPGVWLSGLRAFNKGFMGNIMGEGFVLGGVFVIGREEQGILLEHREIEFGDKVNIEEVLRAARRIPQELLSLEK